MSQKLRIRAAGFFEDRYAVRVEVVSDKITRSMKVGRDGFPGMQGG